MARAVFHLALVLLTGCATDPIAAQPKPAPKVIPFMDAAVSNRAPPPPPAAPPPSPSAPVEQIASDLETKHVSEQDWLAQVRQRIAARWKIEPEELRFSPAQTLVAFVQTPPISTKKKPSRRPKPRVYTILVVDIEGRRQHRFRPVRQRGQDDPPKDLRFLGDDRLVYEVVLPPPEPAPPTPRPDRRRPTKPKETPPARARSGPPERLFVVQPLRKRSRPIRCQGIRFSFNARKDRLGFVAGQPGAEFVALEAARVYPRGRGHTTIASDLAWSKDHLALAFVELPPEGNPRLVLIADIGNPTGDTTWDLPTSTADGLRVFWATQEKIVVGRSITRPVFATTFTIQRPVDSRR